MSVHSSAFSARHPLALLTLGVCLGLFHHGAAAGQQVKPDRAAFADRVLFAPTDRTFEHDGFIIYYRDDAAPEDSSSAQARRVLGYLKDDVARAASELGIHARVQRRLATGGHLLTVRDEGLDAEAANRFMLELAKNPQVVSVEPNLRMYPAALPNDPLLPYQWGLLGPAGGINAEPAWDRADGSGIVIAVIDTGRTFHPDLDLQTVAGMDMISDPANARDGSGRDGNPQDEGDWNTANLCGPNSPARDSSWHGTHVAGIAAARTDNSMGIAGVAYNARLQHVRVLGTCGGNLADIAEGIIWASGGAVSGLPNNATPARVLNLSIQGISSCGTTYQNAINNARSRGSVLIVAAGNHAIPASESTPGNCQGVVTVAANGPTGTRAVYSNYGLATDITAPGGDSSNSTLDGILSTINLGTTVPGAADYNMMDGTSMATPYVAGVAALMLSRNPGLTPDQIGTVLRNTARPFPSFFSGGGGTGIVDAGAAVAVADGAAITRYPLSLALYGSGGGNISSTPGGIACGSAGATCSTRFNVGSTVTLTATPASGSMFSGWGGACAGSASTCTVSMNGGKAVYASFDPQPVVLSNGVAVSNLSSPEGSARYFQMQVPAGATHLSFQTSGGSGDADLYVRRGSMPGTGQGTYDCRSWNQGNGETCSFATPAAGTWYVMVHAYAQYTGVTLRGSYTPAPGGGSGIFCDGMEAQRQPCP